VDPYIEPEQRGLSPNAPKEEEGANYLRRLKTQAAEDAPSTPPATSSIAVPATAGSPGFKERRRSPRFQCSGSAEFWPEGSEVRMWGTLTDVSLHGCYVEMNNTFPLGTRMRLTLEALGVRVRVQGTVRVSYPFLGMGICFSEIEPAQQLQLEQLLTALAGQSSQSDTASTPVASSTHSLADVDSKTMLDELTEFFRSNQLLSRKEFYQIANRARR
jgi:PilZ domain